MNNPVLTSTFILTILLAIGLFFFIRASTKDRIEQMVLESNDSEAVLLPQLDAYFTERAYKVASVDRDTEIVTFEGIVRPSIFLTVLLTGLAAIGAMCLALVLSMVLPDAGAALFGLLLVAPLAGWFYWQGSARTEQVRLKVESPSNPPAATTIKISGHRDELAVFQETLKLSTREEIE
ncbi:cofactor assembly of complex C subunit B [Chamaesiphon sp. VAR_48_metabat_403]|uniref:cofactor assembly of complex C subunit B n=1 Tax=Chamaesiphon sp. VAR_48_metabat_403 TaxID=2964700 RepID=UPI00286E36F9|nr:cofactor assembly of complex C subunit B [Chamaesiphon sp. VAR_48_metabat_403]